MTELGGELDLSQETFTSHRCRDVIAQDLQGHVAIVLEVVRELYGGHASLAEFAFDAVSVTQCCIELIGRAHRVTGEGMNFVTVRP